MTRRIALLLLAALAAPLVPAPAAAEPVPAAAATSGTFSMLTYNIAGLPEGISGGNPEANTPVIGERIGAYDIVHVQEDFNYHASLYAADDHPYRTPTSGGAAFGDGLNTLSSYPYSDLVRVEWDDCNGTDCLTPKGFTFTRIRLAEGVYVDVYNAHPNAGVTEADLAARRSNIQQLSEHIAAVSAGNAVIVAGDTNTRYTRTGDNIRLLTAGNGLTDAWVQLIRGGSEPPLGSPALVCDEGNVTDDCEVVDKILYRDGAYVNLTATAYANENAAFLDADGEPLSDHYPHVARFSWNLTAGLGASDLFGGPHGTPFTDVAAVAGTRPTRIWVRAGARVDAVGVTLSNGTTRVHGGGGGTEHALTLAAGEYVTKIRLCSGQRDGRTRIFFAELTTNLGRVVSGGTVTGTTVTYTAPPGWEITGFHGNAGSEVDKLGVLHTPAG